MSANRYPSELLKRVCSQIYMDYGYSQDDAETIVDVLIEADMMGIQSHGLQRIDLYSYGIEIGRIKVDANIKTVSETPVSALIDADAAMGQLAGVKAMRLAIDKARSNGIGIVLVRNSNHYGIAGYYTLLAVKEALLGISMTNTQKLVVPTFGREPMLGTNPIAVSMPGDPIFHLDMAISVCTAGKMEVYSKNGEKIPQGWLIDWNGECSTNPDDFMTIRRDGLLGGILPIGGEGEILGGHKGFGLGLVVELLTGILSNGGSSLEVRKVPNKENCSHIFIALDYRMFGEPKEIEKRFSEYLKLVQGSAKAKGRNRIFIPGEKEFEEYEKSKTQGVLVTDKTRGIIIDLCKKHGIKGFDFLK